MRTLAIDSVMCLSVCLYVTHLRFTKTAERIVVLFGVGTLVGLSNTVLNGGRGSEEMLLTVSYVHIRLFQLIHIRQITPHLIRPSLNYFRHFFQRRETSMNENRTIYQSVSRGPSGVGVHVQQCVFVWLLHYRHIHEGVVVIRIRYLVYYTAVKAVFSLVIVVRLWLIFSPCWRIRWNNYILKYVTTSEVATLSIRDDIWQLAKLTPVVQYIHSKKKLKSSKIATVTKNNK